MRRIRHFFMGSAAGMFLACFLFQSIQEPIVSPSSNASTSSKHYITTKNRDSIDEQQISSSSLLTRRSNATNFRLEPDRFVNGVTTCFHDSNCRIYYLHTGKTGGQDVEKRMFSIFPPKLEACCGERVFDRFRANTSQYCLAKFSSYEVSGNDFLKTIVSTCMTILSEEQGDKKNNGGGSGVSVSNSNRAIVLATYREPIQRTLSEIHQLCNKNWDRRDHQTQEACRRCSFEKDRDYWTTRIIERGVSEYEQLQDVVNANIPNVSILTIDTADLFSMYKRLSSSLDVDHSRAFHVTNNDDGEQRANVERTTRCNFGFPSEMMRGLKTAEEVYRNLTLGLSSA